MIARGDSETVIIEVTTSSSLQKQTKLAQLAAQVELLPNHRFELATVSTRVSEGQLNIEQSVICNRCKDAAKLIGQGFIDAALLLTWSAAEGMLRLLAQREGLEVIEKDPPLKVLRTVYASGLLEREEYDLILQIAQVRNEVTHGFVSAKVNATQILSVTHLIQGKLRCP
jgi:hypothetical protein